MKYLIAILFFSFIGCGKAPDVVSSGASGSASGTSAATSSVSSDCNLSLVKTSGTDPNQGNMDYFSCDDGTGAVAIRFYTNGSIWAHNHNYTKWITDSCDINFANPGSYKITDIQINSSGVLEQFRETDQNSGQTSVFYCTWTDI